MIFLPNSLIKLSKLSRLTRCLSLAHSAIGNLPTFHEKYYEFSKDFPEDLKKSFYECFAFHHNFISVEEENHFMQEIEPIMKRMRYQFDHWDNAIQGFKETEKLQWNKANSEVLDRVKSKVFVDSECLPHTHVLDLDEAGHIKPHIDSVRFCGNIIAGISLLSDAVMRLQKNNGYYCDVFLERRSMYIMSGPVRLEYTHEVFGNEKSIFRGEKVHKKRRVSVILRSEPEDEEE